MSNKSPWTAMSLIHMLGIDPTPQMSSKRVSVGPRQTLNQRQKRKDARQGGYRIRRTPKTIKSTKVHRRRKTLRGKRS